MGSYRRIHSGGIEASLRKCPGGWLIEIHKTMAVTLPDMTLDIAKKETDREILKCTGHVCTEECREWEES
jgi:hypothetical protein